MSMAPAFILWLVMAAVPGESVPPGKARASGADVPSRRGPAVRQDKDDVLIGPYRLQPKPSGGYRAVTDQFTAFVAADGAVTFEDKPRLPGVAVIPALVLGALLENPDEHRRFPQDHAKQVASRPNLLLADDDLRDDPHHAKKMQFIDMTAHFREGLQRRNDTGALRAFRRTVEAAASDIKLPPRQRRQNLYELWAECDDSERGAPAREVVESAARRHFPPGSAQAFTPDELARWNRSVSAGPRFDPYATPPPAPR